MKEVYGIVDGKNVYLHTIKNENLQISVSEYGATLISVKYYNQETILSHPSLEGYFDNGEFFGCIVLPIANRTGNAMFKIDDNVYHLEVNDNKNNLHTSLFHGSNKRIWEIKEEKNSLVCTIEFKDGEKGVPGNRKVKVIYSIENDSLHIDYWTISDKKSIFAPTNHAYFNLDGSKDVLDHELKLNCSYTTEIDNELIETGKLIDVTNTPLDFRKGKKIGKDIRCNYQQLVFAKGYDFNFCLDNYDGSLKEIASLYSAKSNIEVKCFTTLPGVQIYSGNYLKNENQGVCMETQFYPNAINIKDFIAPIIEANKEYTCTTIYKYGKR